MTEQKVKIIIETELSIEDINERIKQEVCYETLEDLTDTKLMCEYKNCNSVKNEIKKLSDVLGKYMDEETKQLNPTLCIDYTLLLLKHLKHFSYLSSIILLQHLHFFFLIS